MNFIEKSAILQANTGFECTGVVPENILASELLAMAGPERLYPFVDAITRGLHPAPRFGLSRTRNSPPWSGGDDRR
jgi:hypothetical protein